MQAKNKIRIDDYAIKALRDTADKDYISARFSYRARLAQPFFWSSLHCLEKYLKCILVLHRLKAEQGHKVTAYLTKIKANLKVEIDLPGQAIEFIERLELAGADIRYSHESYEFTYLDIVYLDRVVWALRQYCLPSRHGFLEEVLASNKGTARSVLVWKNLYFAKFPKKKIRLQEWYEYGNTLFYENPELAIELQKFIYISRELLMGCKELAAERASQ